MPHPIVKAARAAGFVAVAPATAHPFDFWREKLDSIPLRGYLKIEHRPEALCGWPVDETTLWCAIIPTPPVDWPHGYGEVSGYYLSQRELDANVYRWLNAMEQMGFDVVAEPRIPDRAAAIRAGLGVHGLFGPMITPTHGSFVHITTMLVHTPPPTGARGPEHDRYVACERCGLCIEACPTGAITQSGLDATKCLRFDMGAPETMPEEHFRLMGRRILGCETCQQACPHNKGVGRIEPTPAKAAHFSLEKLTGNPDIDAIASMLGSRYAKRHRIMVQAILSVANCGRRDLLPRIEELTLSDEPAVARAAAWAATKLSA